MGKDISALSRRLISLSLSLSLFHARYIYTRANAVRSAYLKKREKKRVFYARQNSFLNRVDLSRVLGIKRPKLCEKGFKRIMRRRRQLSSTSSKSPCSSSKPDRRSNDDENKRRSSNDFSSPEKKTNKHVSFCNKSTVVVFAEEEDQEEKKNTATTNNNDSNNFERGGPPVVLKFTYQEEKLMDAPSKIRLETSNELKHQRAKMKEKLSHVEEQFDNAKRSMAEGEFRECASILENVVVRELAERINARQFQMNLEKLRFQRHRRLAILEEQTRVGGGKLKRKPMGLGVGGRSENHHQEFLDAETMMMMTTTTTTTTTTMDISTEIGEDDSVSGKKSYGGITNHQATTEKALRRRSGESSASEASTLQMQLGINNTNNSSGSMRDIKSDDELLPSPKGQKYINNASVMMDGSTRSSPSASTDSFVDINRVTQSNAQHASSELTATQEKNMNFKVSPAPPARELKTPQELTMIESALEMCAKAYENMGNKWAAEQKLNEAAKIREIITRCDPTTDTVAAVASPLQNFCPIEPTSMNSTLTHQTKLFETRMKQLFSSSVSSAAAAAAAAAAASEIQS